MQEGCQRFINRKRPGDYSTAVAHQKQCQLNVKAGMPVRRPIDPFAFTKLNRLGNEIATVKTIDEPENAGGSSRPAIFRWRKQTNQHDHRDEIDGDEKNLKCTGPDNSFRD